MYREDLAAIHHEGFGDFARGAAPGILALLRAAGIDRGTVVDLGCGSGITARALLRAGYDVEGVDASRALVRIARRQAPGATFRVGSLYDVALPSCDAVTAVSEVLSYCPPGRSTRPPLRRLFRRVRAALRPGGLFVFDLFAEGGGRPMAYRTWRAAGSWAVLSEVSEDVRRRRLTREITTFRRTAGGTYRRDAERHVAWVARPAEVAALLRAEGFSVRTSRRYGACELPPRRIAFRARRPRCAPSRPGAPDTRPRGPARPRPERT